ncbi:conserved domain protein [Streptococcus infantis SK970]|nr:conserved domain protein [Streptococcus infantis SK970]
MSADKKWLPTKRPNRVRNFLSISIRFQLKNKVKQIERTTIAEIPL